MNSPRTRSVSIKGMVVAALLLSVMLLSVFLFLRHIQNPLDADIKRRVQRSQGYLQKWEQKGILSASDQARLFKISTYIAKRQEISDDDLDFWIALLHRGPLKDTPSNRIGFYTDVLSDGSGRKHLTPSQQQKMYDAVLPYVSDAAYAKAMDPSDTRTARSSPSTQVNLRTGCEKIAVYILEQTHDRRALGVLKDMAQNSPYPDLRQTAKEYYDGLAKALQ